MKMKWLLVLVWLVYDESIGEFKYSTGVPWNHT
jgi:hypothetical protein